MQWIQRKCSGLDYPGKIRSFLVTSGSMILALILSLVPCFQSARCRRLLSMGSASKTHTFTSTEKWAGLLKN